MEGCTDLYRLGSSTLAAIRYQNEIVGPIVRPYPGPVCLKFLLVHDNSRSHAVRVYRPGE